MCYILLSKLCNLNFYLTIEALESVKKEGYLMPLKKQKTIKIDEFQEKLKNNLKILSCFLILFKHVY